jgi:hypothetical protein
MTRRQEQRAASRVWLDDRGRRAASRRANAAHLARARSIAWDKARTHEVEPEVYEPSRKDGAR